MRYWVILNQKWISILQLVPGPFRDHLVDISLRFCTVFHHIYQWVKFEIIILDDSSDIQPY